MANKGRRRPDAAAGAAPADKPATLKDLLDPEVVQKLSMQADQMKADEERRKELARKQAEEARKAEQKRLDNDFGHLLSNSSLDWKKFK